jgi:hypothetical protein
MVALIVNPNYSGGGGQRIMNSRPALENYPHLKNEIGTKGLGRWLKW